MAITKAMREAKKAELLELYRNFAIERGEDARDTGSNVFMFPFCYENGEEDFAKITIQIPTGSRDGEPYDGYGEADSWELKKKEKAIKKEKADKAKAEKIRRDIEYRAKQKANREKANEGH